MREQPVDVHAIVVAEVARIAAQGDVSIRVRHDGPVLVQAARRQLTDAIRAFLHEAVAGSRDRPVEVVVGDDAVRAGTLELRFGAGSERVS